MINAALHFWELLVPSAHAQGLAVWCGSLPGCGSGGEIVSKAIVAVLSIFVALAGSLATIFFIYGAVQMVMPWNEGSEENGKKTIKNALIGLGIALLSGAMVEIVASEGFGGGAGIDPFLSFVRGISRIMQTLFNALFFLAVIYAGITMVMDRGKGEGYQKGFTIIRWAVTGGIILNLSKAILDAFINLLVLN